MPQKGAELSFWVDEMKEEREKRERERAVELNFLIETPWTF